MYTRDEGLVLESRLLFGVVKSGESWEREEEDIRADGGIGIRDSLRSYWGNPWRFKSSSAQVNKE